MIQVIAGTVGFYDGMKVVPITAEDGPITLEPAVEQRLVSKGVAKYVDDAGMATPAGDAAEYSDAMKLADLKGIALKYGADPAEVKKATSKAKAIELIEAAKADNDDDTEADDGEQPPQFGASDPV